MRHLPLLSANPPPRLSLVGSFSPAIHVESEESIEISKIFANKLSSLNWVSMECFLNDKMKPRSLEKSQAD